MAKLKKTKPNVKKIFDVLLNLFISLFMIIIVFLMMMSVINELGRDEGFAMGFAILIVFELFRLGIIKIPEKESKEG